MAFGDNSSPVRFGKGASNPVDNRSLYLDVFGGEVLTAFDNATVTLDKHTVKSLSGGAKSYRFPKTWKASAEYHTPGQEMLGNDFDTSELTINVDDILVSHYAIADLDRILSHFDMRSIISNEMGRALAKVFDQNVFRQIILASRTAATSPFPGGNNVTDASLAATAGVYSGIDWIDAIREANTKLFNQDVPENMQRYLAVKTEVFDAIKYAKDSNGQYLVLNRDFGHGGAGGIDQRAETMNIDGVIIVKSKNIPETDESSATGVFSKYRGDYSNTVGVMWCPQSVATVKLLDISMETERDVRRLEDFMVSKMFVGHGTMRPEMAVEFKTA
tara:strand:+ start:15789 stop:16781 length:993 start_codon:yes stop_codon:yes gene_type:complete